MWKHLAQLFLIIMCLAQYVQTFPGQMCEDVDTRISMLEHSKYDQNKSFT